MLRRPRGPIAHALPPVPFRTISVIGALLLVFALMIGMVGISPAAAAEGGDATPADSGGASNSAPESGTVAQPGQGTGEVAGDPTSDSEKAPEASGEPIESVPNPAGALSAAAGPASLAIVIDSSAATAPFRDDWRAGVVGVLDAARDAGKDGTRVAVIEAAQDPAAAQALDPKDPAQYETLMAATDAALTPADGESPVPDWQAGLDVVARAQQDGVAQFSDVVALAVGESPVVGDAAPDGAVAPEGVSDAAAQAALTANAVKQQGARVLAFAEHAVDEQQALDDADLEFLAGSIEGAEVPSHTVGAVRQSLELIAGTLTARASQSVQAGAKLSTAPVPGAAAAAVQGNMTAIASTNGKALNQEIAGYRTDAVNIRMSLYDAKVDTDRGDITDLVPIEPSADPAGDWQFVAQIWQRNANQRYVLIGPDKQQLWSATGGQKNIESPTMSYTPKGSTSSYALQFYGRTGVDIFNSFDGTGGDDVRITVKPPGQKNPGTNYQMTCFFNDEGAASGLGTMVQYKNSGATWIPDLIEGFPTAHVQRVGKVRDGIWVDPETIVSPDAGDIVTCNVVRSHRPQVTLDIDWANSTDVSKTGGDASKFKMSLGAWTPARPGPAGGAWSLPAYVPAEMKNAMGSTVTTLGPGTSAYLYPAWRYPQGATKAEPIPFNLDIGNPGYVANSWKCEAGNGTNGNYSVIPLGKGFQGKVDIAGVVGKTAVVEVPSGRDLRCTATVEKRTESIALWSADRTDKAVWALKPDGATDVVSVSDCTAEGACSGLSDLSDAAGYFMARVPAATKYTLRESAAPPGWQFAVKANTTQSSVTASPGSATNGAVVDLGAWTHAPAVYPDLLRMTASVATVQDEKGGTLSDDDDAVKNAKAASKVEIAWKHDATEKAGPSPMTVTYVRSAGTASTGPVDFPQGRGPDFIVTPTIPEGFRLVAMQCTGVRLGGAMGRVDVEAQDGRTLPVSFAAQWQSPTLRPVDTSRPYNSWDCGITIRKVPPIYSTIKVTHAGVTIPGNPVPLKEPGDFKLRLRAFGKGELTPMRSSDGTGDVGVSMAVMTADASKPERFEASVMAPAVTTLPVYQRSMQCEDLSGNLPPGVPGAKGGAKLSVPEKAGVMSLDLLQTPATKDSPAKPLEWSCQITCEVGVLVAAHHATVQQGPAKPSDFEIRIAPGSTEGGRDARSLDPEDLAPTPFAAAPARLRSARALAARTDPVPVVYAVVPVPRNGEAGSFKVSAKRPGYVASAMTCTGTPATGQAPKESFVESDANGELILTGVEPAEQWECAVTSVPYKAGWTIDLPRAGGVSSDLLLFSGLAVMGSAVLLAFARRRRLH